MYELLRDELMPLLEGLVDKVDMILQAGVFFGFVFLALNFISKRWLTLNG